MTIQSTVGFKGTPIYIAPEIWKTNQCTKAGDQPFNGFSSFDFAVEVVQNGKRPDFLYEIPEVYRSLIERCWSEDPTNRPSFDQIVTELRENPEYITDDIDQDDFLNYVDYIDQCQKSFDKDKAILSIEDILQNKPTNLLRKAVIKKKEKKSGITSTSSKNSDAKEIKEPQTFYEELTKSSLFKKLNQDVQNFFKYVISPDTKEKNITLNRNNLSNLSKWLLSDEFINVLKLFDHISIELKYPSHDFQKLFDAVKTIKNNDLQKIHVNLFISSRETNFILGNNQALNSIEINSCLNSICDSSFNGCRTLKENTFFKRKHF